MRSFDDILRLVRHPGRYLGNEINAVSKNQTDVICRVALCYPDLYELAMSYLGLQVLYDAVNSKPDLWAERVFAPDVDLEKHLRQSGLPLASLESRTPLHAFDLVGFTLQHELNFVDVLAMLALGGIPLRSAERSGDHPIVIAGGPCASNPEPLAETLDAVFIGDGEEGIIEVARLVGRLRRLQASRSQILDELQGVSGIYLPQRYRIQYGLDGALAAIEPLAGAPAVVKRRLLPDLDRLPPPPRPVVAGIKTIHDRLTVEIQRGCTRGCRFCHAGMINRPVRQRSADTVLTAVDRALACTGYEQVSLLSLSAGDHPNILGILERFFDRHADARIGASLPSLRAETLTPRLAEIIRTVRTSSFTIAPEAGSDRLRRVINKDIGESDIHNAAVGAFRAGWRLLKLYFMIGLPTETAADREAIIALVARLRNELLAAGLRPRINIGVSTFVPKAHTPFQWEPMLSRAEIAEIHAALKEGFRNVPGVKLAVPNPEMSWAEGLLARGDRRQCAALVSLVEAGQRLAGWSEHYQARLVEQAFAAIPVPGAPEVFRRGRSIDAVFPWQHLDLGPSREFLLQERERALAGELTPDCSREMCNACGACAEGITPRLDQTACSPTRMKSASGCIQDQGIDTRRTFQPSDAGGSPTWIRLRFSKTGPASLVSHLEFLGAIERSLRRAGWPLWYTKGFHPKPRLSCGPACPVGTESRAEFVDVGVQGQPDLSPLVRALREQLSGGIDLLSAELLPPGAPGIMRRAVAVRYRLFLGNFDAERAERGALELQQRDRVAIARTTKGRVRAVDARGSIARLVIERGRHGPEAVLELILQSGPMARPSEVATLAFGLTDIPMLREELVWAQPVPVIATGEQA
jgi:radical SAM family uncharacterized protein/radical SAM-linked protein